MATTSTVPTLKAQLVSRLAVRPGMAGVSVTYAEPGELLAREAIYLDEVRGVHNVRVTTGGRVPREEQYTVDLIVRILDSDGAPEDAEARAFAVLGEVENELASTPRLGLTVIDWAEAREYRLETAQYEDGALAKITLGVEVFAQLT